ncbi:uncharacterized protein METZ01_LOCUS204748, partial [marine metagenome]
VEFALFLLTALRHLHRLHQLPVNLACEVKRLAEAG